MDRDRQDRTSDAAAFWDARLRAPSCTEKDRREFAHWRDADPAHREAFERLQTIVTGLRNEMSSPDLRSMRDAALDMADRRQRHLNWAIAAGVVGLAVAALVWTLAGRVIAPAGVESYVTGVGQRSTVTLQDGSSLDLNSKTRVDVVFSNERRSVELLEGQAIFRVAKNPDRPFVVHAGDREIVAIGTAFDVRLEKSAVRVTLLEGKVAVAREGRTAGTELSLTAKSRTLGTVFLSAGEQLVVARSTGERPSVRNIDVAKVASWREGRVFLEDLALSDAVAEMNKHSVIQIIVGDRSLEGLRVNGMFRAGEQQAFATALEEYFPIVAELHGETQIVLRPRG